MRIGIGTAAAVGLLALAACDKGGSAGGSGGGAVSLLTGGWKTLDACATLDKSKVAAATGAKVTEATLSAVNEGTGSMASLSTCSYVLDNGGTIGVLLRESPEDNEPAIPADYRAQSEQTGIKLEPVAGLGQGAFWADGLKSLQVFVDKRRYTAINYSVVPAGADAQVVLTKIAKDLGA